MKKTISILAVLATIFSHCTKNTEPIATFTANYLYGTPDTSFIFDASASADAETPNSLLQFRWQYDTDELWDTEWSSSPILETLLPDDTIYDVTVEVMDEDGLTSTYSEFVTVDSQQGLFIDQRDGTSYTWAKIAGKTWMSENLAYLPAVNPPSEGSQTEPYYYVYGYHGTNVDSAKSMDAYANQGVFYNWPAAMDGGPETVRIPSGVQGICPNGWHLPSSGEYNSFYYFMENPGINCKSTTGWDGDGNGDNSSGFNAFPVGVRSSNTSDFGGKGRATEFWSTSPSAWRETEATIMGLYFHGPGVGQRPVSLKDNGVSVRCVKDD